MLLRVRPDATIEQRKQLIAKMRMPVLNLVYFTISRRLIPKHRFILHLYQQLLPFSSSQLLPRRMHYE
jgi:hypothetical protein